MLQCRLKVNALKNIFENLKEMYGSISNMIDNDIERQPLSATSNTTNANANTGDGNNANDTLELRKVASVSNSQVVGAPEPVNLPPQAKPNDIFAVQSTNALEMQEFEREIRSLCIDQS